MAARRKIVKPEPQAPEPIEPPPARCPLCRSAKVVGLGATPSGLLPWRCGDCRRIGYGERVIGEPVPALQRAPLRRTRSDKPMSRFVRRPAKNVNPEDIP